MKNLVRFWWFPNLAIAIVSSSLLIYSFMNGAVGIDSRTNTWNVFFFIIHIPYAIIVVFLFGGLIEHLGYYIKGKSKKSPGRLPSQPPSVCVQLPMYNEHKVAKRAIEASCALEWPRELLEVQVLDDSTDKDTRTLVEDVVSFMNGSGYDCRLIRRERRDGYKAGALEVGRRKTNSELILILDADFVPEPDYLQKAVPYFFDHSGNFLKGLALVQAQWGHLNYDESLLTSAQSLWVDDHHTIQMSWRSSAWKFVNFTGTAGIWLAEAIENVGGWRSASLVEDCELSFRHLFSGYYTSFVKEIVVPAELPNTFTAYKAQQKRWTQGWIQLYRLHFATLVKEYRTSFVRKIHLVYHISIAWQWMAWGIWLLVLPFAIFNDIWLGIYGLQYKLAIYGMPSLIYLFFITVISTLETRNTYPKKRGITSTIQGICRMFPYIIINTGMLPHQFTACTEGFFGTLHSEFERTPKASTVTGNGTSNSQSKTSISKVFNVRVHKPYVAAEIFFVAYNIGWSVLFFGTNHPYSGFTAAYLAACVLLLMWFYGDHLGRRLFVIPERFFCSNKSTN